ncbi:MAG: hypothetical protein U5L04_05485 [Trueperaceae bacterium]|nr:hypothetical protein [Trueperaceae bacterium]
MIRHLLVTMLLASTFGIAQNPIQNPVQNPVQNPGSIVTPLRLDAALTPLGQRADIDWSRGVLRAVGAGRVVGGDSAARRELLATGAARADALRLLALLVNNVPVSGQREVGDYAISVDAFVQGARIGPGRRVRLADGTEVVWVEATLPLFGSRQALAALVLPLHRETGRSLSSSLTSAGAGAGYSGLIVEVRGVGLEPSLAPRIVTPERDLVYSIRNLPSRGGNGLGLVAYYGSPQHAAARVGTNPLVVVVTPTTTDGPVDDLVVGPDDARRILAADATNNFLSRGRVAVVWRP